MTVLPRGEKPASREILKESLVVDWSKEALAQAYYSRQSIQLHVFLYIRCVYDVCMHRCLQVRGGTCVHVCAHEPDGYVAATLLLGAILDHCPLYFLRQGLSEPF